MRDCENVVERLPELLHDRLPTVERERVLAHVRGCADCTAEVAWLRATRDGIVAAAPRVDVAAIARGVHAKLGAAPALRLVTTDQDATPIARRAGPPRRSFWASTQIRAAAALALVAAGAGAVAIARNGIAPVAAVSVGVADTQTFDTTGRTSRVATSATPAPSTTTAPLQVASAEPGAPLGVSLGDLSDAELAAVIAAVDDEGGTLPADPAPSAPVVTSGGTP